MPVRDWVKILLYRWTDAAKITTGKAGLAWGTGMTETAVWHIVREYAAVAGVSTFAPTILCRRRPHV